MLWQFVFLGQVDEAERDARGPRPVCGTLRAMRTLLVVIASMLAGMAMATEPVDWKVVSVHDGDTFTAVDAANVQHKVRLQGIDASEVKQAFGTKARDIATTRQYYVAKSFKPLL